MEFLATVVVIALLLGFAQKRLIERARSKSLRLAEAQHQKPGSRVEHLRAAVSERQLTAYFVEKLAA